MPAVSAQISIGPVSLLTPKNREKPPSEAQKQASWAEILKIVFDYPMQFQSLMEVMRLIPCYSTEQAI